MSGNPIRRKLTTIFCADVQRFSAMMLGDEASTLARLKRYRAIMNDLFDRHEGRQVNTWGDAVIAEFASVVEAVRCGVEIQDAIGAENRDLPAAEQMWFRIGINLGDVMQDGNDLYGDGVNVAARLESLASPGGIMVSRTVYDLTHKQLAFGYEYAGEQRVKGLDEPVAGYRVRIGGANADNAEPASAAHMSASPRQTSPDEAFPLEDRRRRKTLLRKWRNFDLWRGRQPRYIQISVTGIMALAGLNILTTGLSDLWFVYPATPFAVLIGWRLLRHGSSGGSAKPGR